MPHMDSPSCLSTHGSRKGRERRQGNRKPCPGPNGALSPASPPGFVTALTTARSRDAPAERFDERLPRRLPYEGALALLFVSPRKPLRSTQLAGRLPQIPLLPCSTSSSSPEQPI